MSWGVGCYLFVSDRAQIRTHPHGRQLPCLVYPASALKGKAHREEESWGKWLMQGELNKGFRWTTMRCLRVPDQQSEVKLERTALVRASSPEAELTLQPRTAEAWLICVSLMRWYS